jgi:hypothetical protein
MTDVSKVLTSSLIKAMSKPETSVNFYHTTRPYIPKDSHIHTFCFSPNQFLEAKQV